MSDHILIAYDWAKTNSKLQEFFQILAKQKNCWDARIKALNDFFQHHALGYDSKVELDIYTGMTPTAQLAEYFSVFKNRAIRSFLT